MTANSITPTDSDIVKERTVFLNKAQTILNEQYLKKKAESYKKWQQDSHQMWITQGILLPYQSAFEYPTQEEIVAKALELYNEKYKNTSQNNTSPPPKEVTPWEMYLTPPPSTPTEAAVEQPQETKIEEPAEVNVEPVIEEPIIEHELVNIEPVIEEPIVERTLLIEEGPIEESADVEETEEMKEHKRQTSYLRQLLAQFITIAKDLDSKTKKEDEK